MTAEENSELAALRAEVAQIRRDLDRALERLDLPDSRSPDYEGTTLPRMEFDQVSVRSDNKHIPVIIHSDDLESGVWLYDAQMRPRGQFVIYADGEARLEILNAERKVVVSIGEGADGGGEVRVNDAGGTTRAGMKVSAHGGALSVVTAEGKVLAALTSDESGGKMFICSPETRVLGSFVSTPAGGRLSVCSPLSKVMVTLASTPQGGLAALAEPGGEVMASLIVTEAGAAMNIHGEQGVPVASLSGLGELGGMVVFSHPDGTPKTMLP